MLSRLKSFCFMLAIILAPMACLVEDDAPRVILDSVVWVNNSSGVVVEMNEDYMLVMTAFHVIKKNLGSNGVMDSNNPITVSITFNNHFEEFEVIDYECDATKDLAILKISSTGMLHKGTIIDTGVRKVKVDMLVPNSYDKVLDSGLIRPTRIASGNPNVGDDVFIGGNPNYLFRTIVKGTLSNAIRVVRKMRMWQISGGVTYGQSGGGAFNLDGELIGITSMLSVGPNGACKGGCNVVPIHYIGYFVPRDEIVNFVLNSKFKDDFEYLM